MISRRAAVLVSGASFQAGAFGQGQFSVGSVHYSLDFAEYSAATLLPVLSPNGYLEPGESAMVRLTMAYSPAYGTPVTYSTTLLAGSSGSGVIGGFSFGQINVAGSGSAEGSWILTGGSGVHRRGPIPPFSNGTPTPNVGGTVIENIQPAQFASGVMYLSTITNVHVWRGLWTPSSFAPRVVTWRVTPSTIPGPSAGLWAIDDNFTVNGFDQPVIGIVPATFGSVEVPILPAPGAWLIIVAACGLAGRRRGIATADLP